jgi:hypothetical protein
VFTSVAYIRVHTASNDIIRGNILGRHNPWQHPRTTPLPEPDPTRQQLVVMVAQLSLNETSSTEHATPEVSEVSCHSLNTPQVVVRQFAIPTNPHFFIFFFERMHACFSLGIPRSLSLFRCCLVRSSGSFKIHTRLCLPRVDWNGGVRSDGERNIMGGPQAGSIGVITQERMYRYRKR